MTDIREVIARAICRVQLNGGDPNQHAVRWNGTEIEPQSFPAWRDYRDEADHVIAALDKAGMTWTWKEPTEAMETVVRGKGGVMDWQTIDTAPRDGTRIILTNGSWVGQGWWTKSVFLPATHRNGAWVDGSPRECGLPIDATHWMPLPPPPTEKARSE